MEKFGKQIQQRWTEQQPHLKINQQEIKYFAVAAHFNKRCHVSKS